MDGKSFSSPLRVEFGGGPAYLLERGGVEPEGIFDDENCGGLWARQLVEGLWSKTG